MDRFLLIACVVALAPPAEAQDDGRGWRWAELDLELWIEPELGSIHLQGQGRLVLEAESSTGPTLLLAGKLQELVAVGAPGGTVELGRRTAEDSDVAELVTARVRYPEARTRGAEIAVDFECQSKGSSDQFAVTARAALASWVEGWYPLPDGGPDGQMSKLMAARGSTRFHLPAGWHGVSNGELVQSAETDGEQRETWRVTQPVARSFACAPYTVARQEVNGRAVSVYRLAGARDPSDAAVQGVAAILRALEERYGPYPYPSWSVAETPDGVGDFLGSSEQGFVMVRPVAFQAADGNLALLGHELAHGWWGNAVSAAGPGSLLLDEALAQYSAVVGIEAVEGAEAAADFLRFSRPGYVTEQCARGYFATWRDGHDQPLATLESGEWAHQLADAKGHWVYHMLRGAVGEERFFGVLRALAHDFTARPLTLPELRARFERAAPDVDLGRFFAQWLDRAGAPILACEWRAEGERTRVTVRQLQPGEPYHLPLELALDCAAGRRLELVDLTGREQSFLLEGAATSAVVLDPQHRLLIWTAEYGPQPLK